MDKHLKSMRIESTEEQVEQIARASAQADVNTEAFAEAMRRVITAFAEACQTLQKIVKDMREQIKEFTDNHNTTTDTRPERKGWQIPRKIIRDHQVFDRRPMVVYIRGDI